MTDANENPVPPPVDDDLRKEARRRLKARNDFRTLIVIFAVITVLLVVIWFLTSGPDSHFWPIWPILGFVIALVFAGLDASGLTRRYVSESDVDREVRKMTGGQ